MRQPLTTFVVVFVTAMLCHVAWNAFSNQPLISHDAFRQTVVLTVTLGLILTAIDRKKAA